MHKRPIKKEEKALIEFLLDKLPLGQSKYEVPNIVIEMNDGGMGSIQFLENGVFGRDLIQVEYKDLDDQPVFVTLVEEKGGSLLELDVWKVDFSPLLQYPPPDQVKIV